MSAENKKQPLSLFEALVPVAGLILLIALSYYLFGDAGSSGPNQVALVFATMIAVTMARIRGCSLDELREAAISSVGSGVGAIFILLGVGALIGTWALSGTLVTMIYYGLVLLNPNYFYVTACAVAAATSFGIGSSWTVAGTIGIGLMGVAANMDLDPAITAAAIISGAYFGDTTSPLSDSANLAAGAGEANLYDHIRETLLTSIPALLLSLGVFWLLGRFGEPGSFDATNHLANIQASFHVSWVLLLPLLVVLLLALLKLPPFTTIFIGALLGGVLAVIVAPERVVAFAGAGASVPHWLALVKGVWLAFATGYVSSSGDPALDAIATRGGMSAMLSTVWLVITAFAFGGVVERAGILERLIAPIVSVAKSGGTLVSALIASVIATNVTTADQYLSIVLPGRMFNAVFAERGLAPPVLSRTIGASGTPTSALVPWNSCGAYLSATLGVSTFHYFPYAVFNFASPILAAVVAFLGIRMLRLTKVNFDESAV
ncbi:Na+/H+ antiporter NhaC [Rhizobium sp. 3T7]|uniref:Na+/H+ antiporter NhaC family protein n=1 Tax=Rhizobium sp. 3T7 TaxID=2874922 RepID=UPI001CC94A9C|nr:Na+/H+ antiporter NhaC family protein [Rhizobium sp. 3T7]MBZ9791905.1 Na+/H+ antiporter NhaC [Rhizobium sp. 3T7]